MPTKSAKKPPVNREEISPVAAELIKAAAEAALKSAGDYVRLHNANVSDFPEACDRLRREIRSTIDAAIGEARFNLSQEVPPIVAEAEFRGAIMLAGLKAAGSLVGAQPCRN